MNNFKKIIASSVILASTASMAAPTDTVTVELVIADELSFDFTDVTQNIDPNSTPFMQGSTSMVGGTGFGTLKANVPYTLTFASANDWNLCKTAEPNCLDATKRLAWGFEFGNWDGTTETTDEHISPETGEVTGSKVVQTSSVIEAGTGENRYFYPAVSEANLATVVSGTYQDVVTSTIAAQ